MKKDADLAEGMIARTLGYYSPNDDGDALYIICDTEPQDMYSEQLYNNAYAKILIGNYVTPEMFGAVGEGDKRVKRDDLPTSMADDTKALALAFGGGVYSEGTIKNYYPTQENDMDTIAENSSEVDLSAYIAQGKVPVYGRKTYYMAGNIAISDVKYDLKIVSGSYSRTQEKIFGILELRDNNNISGSIENLYVGGLAYGRILISVTGHDNDIHHMHFSGRDTTDLNTSEYRAKELASAGAAIVVYSTSNGSRINSCTFEPAFKVDILSAGNNIIITDCNFKKHDENSLTNYYTNAIKLTDYNNATSTNGKNIIIKGCLFEDHSDNPIDIYTGAQNLTIDGCIFNSPSSKCIEIKTKPGKPYINSTHLISNCIMHGGRGLIYAVATRTDEYTTLGGTPLQEIVISNCIGKSIDSGAIILTAFKSVTLNNCYIDAGNKNVFSGDFSIICNGCTFINATVFTTRTIRPDATRILNGCYFEGQTLGIVTYLSDWHISNSIIKTSATPIQGVAGRLFATNNIFIRLDDGSSVNPSDVKFVVLQYKENVPAEDLDTYPIQIDPSIEYTDFSYTERANGNGITIDYYAKQPVCFIGNTFKSEIASSNDEHPTVFTLTPNVDQFPPPRVVASYNDLGGNYLSSYNRVDALLNFNAVESETIDIIQQIRDTYARRNEIPYYVSELSNDMEYQTEEEVTNAINSAIGNIASFDIAIVDELPTTQMNNHTIYLVPKIGETNDVYDEYIYVNNAWEMVGNTQIDLSNYVQKTDYATTNEAGVVKIDSSYGIQISSNGYLQASAPSDSQIKSANKIAGTYRPIVPSVQHISTFYGLAKAAGHDEKDSTEPVGTYTPEAKGAIQQMLGVSDLIATAENSLVASKTYKVGEVFTANGKLYKATAAIAADAAIIPAVEGEEIAGANCEETSVGEGFVKFTDYATSNTPGVVISNPVYGTYITNGHIVLQELSINDIKSGTWPYKAISPKHQHESTFYGLAKAAGDTTQSASSNAVGTYTDEAKTAIKSMIGINVDDVQVNGTSVVSDGIAEIPRLGASGSGDYGVCRVNQSFGVTQNGDSGYLILSQINDATVKAGDNQYIALTPRYQHKAVFYGLAKASGDTTQSASSNAVGQYTDNAKASIKAMLGVQDGSTGTVDVSSTTPTITAVENTRYVCGEVTSLNFTPPASGIAIVRFTSGSSVTVLTIPSTVKFPEWFDPTSLETNTIYEICVTDGVYGAVMSWAL